MSHDAKPIPASDGPPARGSLSEKEGVTAVWKDATVLALEEIRRMVRSSGMSQRKVEERAGFSKGYMSQLFSRNLELKLWHVLAILDVLGCPPGQFFSKVYPRPAHLALDRFRKTSRPLTDDMDEILGRLYEHGIESLEVLRQRLMRCESAVTQLEEQGLVECPPRR